VERMRWTSITVCASVLLACNRKIEEPPQSNRHRAEAHCTHMIDLGAKCRQEKLPEEERVELPGDDRRERIERCMASPKWDWTDHCADIHIAQVDCTGSITTCEEYDMLGEVRDGLSPCAEEYMALASCKVYDEHGNEIDHGQGSR
jgi:hypothetical protein